jgi:hypothetical protein
MSSLISIFNALLIGGLIGLLIGIYLGRRKVRDRDRDMKKWEKTRERGMFEFVIINGFLIFGLTMAAVTFLVGLLIDPPPNLFLDLMIRFLTFPIVGILFGILMWYSAERRFRRWRSQFDPVQ